MRYGAPCRVKKRPLRAGSRRCRAPSETRACPALLAALGVLTPCAGAKRRTRRVRACARSAPPLPPSPCPPTSAQPSVQTGAPWRLARRAGSGEADASHAACSSQRRRSASSPLALRPAPCSAPAQRSAELPLRRHRQGGAHAAGQPFLQPVWRFGKDRVALWSSVRATSLTVRGCQGASDTAAQRAAAACRPGAVQAYSRSSDHLRVLHHNHGAHALNLLRGHPGWRHPLQRQLRAPHAE